MYRPFNPPSEITAREFFDKQMCQIKTAYENNSILLGDFNLDWSKKGNHAYAFRKYFEHFDECMSERSCVQLVKFPTWSRIVNNIHRESIIDHVYVQNPCVVHNLRGVKPYFGDHSMVIMEHELKKQDSTTAFKRDWKNYSKTNLRDLLSTVDWNLQGDTVQDCWNDFETKLMCVVDQLVPITEFDNDVSKPTKVPTGVKNLMNIRKRLLVKYKSTKSPDIKLRIKCLDKKIRSFFHSSKLKNVRRSIIPGNSGSLWKAVKIANDVNHDQLPEIMSINNLEVKKSDRSDVFASFFDKKIRDIIDTVSVNEGVYNGTRKVNSENKFFMSREDVLECMLSLKCKNSEGFDRIPQRILLDGAEILVEPLSILFEKIYYQKNVPAQWLVAKTIPVFKNKGDKKKVESYRPIANLCATSKIFEKLILKRILELQNENNCDLTGNNQHGFKRKRSTSTLSMELQSLIARALDEDKFVLLSSLDLSAAFDIVNIDLLLKRLTIIGLPCDVINLISVWLKERSYYVSIDGINSVMFDLLLETVQGSILGPVLYAIFVSPIFDIDFALAFADDNFIPKINTCKIDLVKDMEKSLTAVTKWLKESGLKVNDSKTELCLFFKHDTAPVTIKLSDDSIVSNNSINILGVLFDTKLTWSAHITKTITKAYKSLNAIKLIRKYFSIKETLLLLTSNFYSVLYYNSEVWLIPSLNLNCKKMLLTASSNALKLAYNYRFPFISYLNLHNMAKRATPSMFTNYKLALMLHNLYNSDLMSDEWIHLNLNQVFTSRQTMFHINKNNNLNVGMNALSNRLHLINDKIPLEWMNKSYNSFKMSCKNYFLTNSQNNLVL